MRSYYLVLWAKKECEPHNASLSRHSVFTAAVVSKCPLRNHHHRVRLKALVHGSARLHVLIIRQPPPLSPVPTTAAFQRSVAASTVRLCIRYFTSPIGFQITFKYDRPPFHRVSHDTSIWKPVESRIGAEFAAKSSIRTSPYRKYYS